MRSRLSLLRYAGLGVNGTSFTRAWLDNRGYWFPILESYLRLDEYPEALRLSVRGRELEWERLLLRKLDDRLWGRRVGHFLRGMKVYFDAERKRLSGGAWPVSPDQPPVAVDWITDVREYDEQFGVFAQINRLAARHGIDVLYYPLAEQHVSSGGTGITSEQDIALIRDAISTGQNVHFMQVSPSLPNAAFSDRWIHLTPAGMSQLADYLLDEIAAIYDARAESD